MRTDDVDVVYEGLTDFIAIKREPHRRIVSRINNMKKMPDRLFVLMRENF